MYKFFINRPIVAMVISIITVIIGLVTLLSLPIAQFPKIIPPEIFIQANYLGADAQTIEQAVATPIEQQMSGVDNMNYMYSVNANNGLMRMYVNFDVKTDANIDHMLTQLRYAQAESQLPADVRNFGVTVQKSLSSPFLFIALFSPNGTRDARFLANYAYINLNDALTRVPGIAQVIVFGAGQYAMRLWVKPAQLATLNITVPEIISAVNNQNTVNPAGRIGSLPVPPGQEFTYSVRAQGRLQSEEEFGEIVLRANADGSIVRLKDVARMELATQDYDIIGRLNGKPSAVLALYQLPGSNALEAEKGVKRRMEELKQRFPADLDYVFSLDTTHAVTEGINEIVKTLAAAIALVMLVVFVFLQGWRATLIPMLAVPVSLIGTFAVFPLLGFSINTLSLFGLVLAVGLVVDDAIVVVCAGLMRKAAVSLAFLVVVAAAAGWFGKKLPGGFLPEEDQGYMFVQVQLPFAASMERTDAVCRQVEQILDKTPGIKYFTTVSGFSLLSGIRNTYSAFFWVTLKDWSERRKAGEQFDAIKAHLNRELSQLPQAMAFAFSPPAIQGVGAAGGFTFILEDRAGKDIEFLNDNLNTFLEAARKRPELAGLSTTFLPVVPQVFVNVDRDKALKQGVDLGEVYKTLQTFMGGAFINYFNRFGRQWQVYVQDEGEFRTKAENLGLFYVRNRNGEPVPLSSLTTVKPLSGPEYTLRYNLYRSAQINGSAAPGYSS